MKKVDLEEARLSLSALLETGKTEIALNFLQTLLIATTTHRQADELLELFSELTDSLLAEHASFPCLYAQALCQARKPEEILCFLEDIPVGPELAVYKAWAFVRLGEPQAALDLLEPLSDDNEVNLGLLWRTKGEALFRLGHTGWGAAFERSRQYLSGVSLGRSLLDQGRFLNESGQRGAARVCWSEALVHLKEDPYYLAWAHNSLGFSLIKDQPQEAERHLLEAVRISKKGAARDFRCRALSGLGAVRRSMGELERALSSYREAIKATGDTDDRLNALWGYGHTLRLLGRIEEALATLLQAHQLNPKECWILADIAAARLMLGDREGAAESLAHVEKWGERSGILRTVVEAEILRQGGNSKKVKRRLSSLPLGNLWVKEELSCFPELQQYVSATGLIPIQKYQVEVNPYGSLEVRVNGRVVPISPTGKPGEMLVFLLVHGGAVSLEQLVDRLMKDDLRDKRKALWEHINALRLALGWRDSVQYKGGVYQLDLETDWVCLDEPDPVGSKEFMHGHYSDWVEERRIYVV